MTCIIIEDQPPAQRILKKYIQDHGGIELLGTFSDGIRAMSFLAEQSVQLIFLDIHLPKLSGVDFLKALSHPPGVIFTTAYPDFALESYDLNAIDYLLKPFSFARFVQAVAKAEHYLGTSMQPTTKDDFIFIKSGHDHIKINLQDLLYIKSDGDYTELYTDEQKLLSTEPLKHWLSTHPSTLVRVHRSYLVNVNLVSRFNSQSVYVGNDIEVPIGRAYKEEVLMVLGK